MSRSALAAVGRVDAATAKRLLREYLRVAFALGPLYPQLNGHELRAAAEDAILEAYLLYRPDRGMAESTWIRRIVHWRIEAAAKETSRTAWDRNADSLDLDPQVVDGVNPEREFLRETASAALSILGPRYHTILTAWMSGETYEEIGMALGISTQRAHKEGQKALTQLRKFLERHRRG